jgi:hypothetical protein
MNVVSRPCLRRYLCACGQPTLRDEVPTGRLYHLDLDTAGSGSMLCGGCGTLIPVTLVYVLDGDGGLAPLELFERGH